LSERLASPEVTLADVMDLATGLAPKFDNDNLITNIDVLLLGDPRTAVESVRVENFYGLEDLGIDSWVHGVADLVLRTDQMPPSERHRIDHRCPRKMLRPITSTTSSMENLISEALSVTCTR
jgi:hypothetical protein